MRRSCASALATTLMLTAVTASAQTWPSRPIRWIVPYPPGGITDTVTRLVTQRTAEALGQPIVIENRAGANSIIGAELVAKAAPDGYTFLTVIAAHSANATLYAGRLPFDVVKSFAPVSLVAVAPLILTTSNRLPAKDIRELIDYAKKNPGKLSFGSSGIGAAAHLATELLKQTTGTFMVHIPYKGTAPAMQGLMGGEIDILVDTPSSLMPAVRSGKIRGLAMFAARRVPGAEEVPTMAESGGPALEASTWVMALAPAATPRETVDRMSATIAKVVNGAEMKGRLEQLGTIPGGTSSADTAKFLAAEIEQWAKVIKTAGVKADD